MQSLGEDCAVYSRSHKVLTSIPSLCPAIPDTIVTQSDMAFGWSVSDIVLLSNLAWRTIENTRKACGEHDELTSALLTFHTVLRRLQQEVSKPESPLNSPGDSSKEDVERIVSGCQKPLSLLNKVVAKYSLLSQEERSLKKLWIQVKFSNGEVANTRDLRDKISSHTSALTLYLNLVSTGSIGRVEKQMEDAGSDLKEVKKVVNHLAARLAIGPHSEGSVLTTRTNDDKAVWKEFRRSLLKQGFNSSFLKKHKSLIEAYLKELSDRGVLDDPQNYDRPIGACLATDVDSDSSQQCNQAAIQEASDVELEQGERSRSASPELEDASDSDESSSSVTMNVAGSQRGPPTILSHEDSTIEEKTCNGDCDMTSPTAYRRVPRHNPSKQRMNHHPSSQKHRGSLPIHDGSDVTMNSSDPLPFSDARESRSRLWPPRKNATSSPVRNRQDPRRHKDSSYTGKRFVLAWMSVTYVLFHLVRNR